MVTNVFPHIYEDLVNEDIEWLKSVIPEDEQTGLYFAHAIQVMAHSVRMYKEYEYGNHLN